MKSLSLHPPQDEQGDASKADATEALRHQEYQRIKSLFAEVCDLPAALRHQRLKELTTSAGDMDAVAKLIAKDQSTIKRKSLTPPAAIRAVASSVASFANHLVQPAATIGAQIGAWVITEKIGEGGMGSVYRAERVDGQFQQVVAIKFLTGFATVEAAAMLVEERKTLAALAHPNIARLIDGGTSSSGQPYIVMDYVDGQAIDEHCHIKQLGIRQIAELGISVCDAVTYAHQSLTLHCDLKPANILVDQDGRPKLLDFGIARLLLHDTHGTDSSGTKSAHTPRYASPEQRDNHAKLSTATDVYSLGAVLGELFDAANARVGSKVANLPAPRMRQLRRELNAIIMRAANKAIEARYASVADLRRDLQRAISNQPVLAMRGGSGYYTSKFIQRHWAASIASTALVIGAVIFTVGLVRERDRAQRAENVAANELQRALVAEGQARAERDRAQVSELRASEREVEAKDARANAIEERDRAVRADVRAQAETANTRQTRDFLVKLFESSDPSRGGDPKMSAAELLKRGKERVAALSDDQAELKSELIFALAKIHQNMGLVNEARALYIESEARQTNQSRPDKVRPDIARLAKLADILERRAILEQVNSNWADAEAPARRSLAIRLQLYPHDSLEVANGQNTLGTVLGAINKEDEALANLQSALAIREKLLKLPNDEVASTLHNLGVHYNGFAKYKEAESYLRRSLEMKQKMHGDTHPRTVNTLVTLGILYGRTQRYSEAEPLLANIHRIYLETYGANSDFVATAANEWGSVLHDMERYDEAEKRYREAINNQAAAPDANGVRPMRYAFAMNNLASLQQDRGDFAAAEESYRASLAVRLQHLKPDDPSLARTRHNLGRMLMWTGKYTDANLLLTQAYDVRLAKLGIKHVETQESVLNLTELALLQGDTARAKDLMQQLDADLPARRAQRQLARLKLDARLAIANGQSPVAAWQAYAAFAEEKFGRDNAITYRAKLDLAEALKAEGKIPEAEALVTPFATAFLAKLVAVAPDRKRVAAILPALAAK
jgi:eukaryotic-like serine/threonine-protein kinase